MRVGVKNYADFDEMDEYVRDNLKHSGVRRTHNGTSMQIALGSISDFLLLKMTHVEKIVWPK